METAEPLTPAWLREFRDRLDPRLTPIQRLAAGAIWAWFDDLWRGEQVESNTLEQLCEEVLPLFGELKRSTGSELDDAIVGLVERLREIGSLVRVRP